MMKGPIQSRNLLRDEQVLTPIWTIIMVIWRMLTEQLEELNLKVLYPVRMEDYKMLHLRLVNYQIELTGYANDV
jgi:hypothetical protein